LLLVSITPLQFAYAGKALGFVLGHGVPANNGMMWKMQQLLQNQSSKPNEFGDMETHKINVSNITYDWENSTLEQQASVLSNEAYALTNVVRPQSDTTPPVFKADGLVLVGHSAGGLRARWFAQQLSDRMITVFSGTEDIPGTNDKKHLYTQVPISSKIKGLVTIGTPNRGALLTQTGYGLMGDMIAALSFGVGASVFSLGLAAAPLSAISTSGIMMFLGALIGGSVGNNFVGSYAGATQASLVPGNPVLEKLNNTTASGFKKLPDNVATLSMVGKRNNFDEYIHDIGMTSSVGLRSTIVWALVAATASLWGLAFWTGGYTAPAALGLTVVSVALSELPNKYNGAVGSSDNDGFIAVNSQRMNFSSDQIVGTTYFSETADLENANHSGINYGEMVDCTVPFSTPGRSSLCTGFQSGAHVNLHDITKAILKDGFK
jgi:pimeloyl-ACP methyl ester carboxylesterase